MTHRPGIKSSLTAIVIGFFVAASVPVFAGPDLMPPAPPPLQLLAPGVFEIGNCKIIKKKNRVEFPAKVNMTEGLLEYVVVSDAGKLHESLLKTEVEPYSLHIALLLMGLEGTLKPLVEQGQPLTPTGDRIDVMVSWQENGKEKQSRIDAWVRKGDDPAGNIPWVYTGSIVRNGVFLAQVEKSIAALFHDPAALIDHQMQDGASDEIWFVNTSKVPPVGTELTVIIEKK